MFFFRRHRLVDKHASHSRHIYVILVLRKYDFIHAIRFYESKTSKNLKRIKISNK